MASNERSIDYDLRYYQSTLEPNVEMAISIQDQQRIFLAYRALFEGQNGQVRQPKTIKKILKTSKNSSSPLAKSLSLDKVVSVLKGLLERGVFSSELNAKLAFPVLYKTSPEQDARHEASDEGAAKEEAEALQEVEALDSAAVEEAGAEIFDIEDASLNEEIKLPATIESLNGPEAKGETLAVPANSRLKIYIDKVDAAQQPRIDTPSLYPVQFPFKVQHSILTKAQRILEECCYDFTQKWAPNLLIEKKWDCAEAIELNRWTFAISKRYGKLPAGAFAKSGPTVPGSLLDVNKLRHSSVHRLRISAKGIIQMIDAAVKFAEALSDHLRASQLEELHKELKSKVKSQELNKNYLETKLKNELDEIQRQREELAKRERQAISTMVTEDEDNTYFIGSLLEGKLRRILDGDCADDLLNDSDSFNQLDDAKIEAADEDPCKANSPKEPESPKATSNGFESSDENEHEASPTDAAVGGSIRKGDSGGFEYVEIPSFKVSPLDYKPDQDTNNSLASRDPNNCESDLVDEAQPEEDPFCEPIAAKSQPPSPGGDEMGLATDKKQMVEESENREPATGILPEVESLAMTPLVSAVQYTSFTDAIQDILEGQEIDTSSLRRNKKKGKKKLRRDAYDAEMTKIKGSVFEHLRREIENVQGSPIFCGETSETLLTAYRVHLRALYWNR